ncbi:MAG TPA: TolC family protein [Burkholderiales bacterium]|nr:TolC family protein [Burkholderiales bacterium]
MNSKNKRVSSGLHCGIVLAGMLGVSPLGHAAEALNLDDYYSAAMKRSEVVATQSELIRQAEERYNRARGGMFPTIDAIATRTWHGRGATDTRNNPRSASNSRITAVQPIFGAFTLVAGLRQAKAEINAQNEDYQNARVQLFRDVAQNFYDILSLERESINLEEEINLSLKREKELQDRVRIGRTRPGEVLTVTSGISTLRAEVQLLQAQLNAAREAFAFLSGLSATTSLRDSEPLTDTLEPLDTYLVGRERRPDVKAAQQRFEAARESVTVARNAHIPSLDVVANRYLERTGSLSEVEWDVSLELIVPLYAGGSVQAFVRERASQRDQAELELSRVNRLAEQEIRTSYRNSVLDRSQLDALEKATDAGRRNYDTQVRDYRLGLVTNLDVLQALTAFQENQRALDRARYTAKLNYLRLQTAAARRPSLSDGPQP